MARNGAGLVSPDRWTANKHWGCTPRLALETARPPLRTVDGSPGGHVGLLGARAREGSSMTPQRRPGRPRSTSRTSLILVGVASAAVLAAAALSAIVGPGGRHRRTGRGAQGRARRATDDGPFGALVAGGPDCGSHGLRGPASRPTGFRAVSPSQRLDSVVDNAPAGTKFWLRRGTTGWAVGTTTRCSRRPAWSSREPRAPCWTDRRRTCTPSRARPPTSPSSTSPSRTSAPRWTTATRASSTTTRVTGGRSVTTRSGGTAGRASSSVTATPSPTTAFRPTGSTASAPTNPMGYAMCASTTTRSAATTPLTGNDESMVAAALAAASSGRPRTRTSPATGSMTTGGRASGPIRTTPGF